jgi:RNA polymerase sigma factor (TIGR02999 family)
MPLEQAVRRLQRPGQRRGEHHLHRIAGQRRAGLCHLEVAELAQRRVEMQRVDGIHTPGGVERGFAVADAKNGLGRHGGAKYGRTAARPKARRPLASRPELVSESAREEVRVSEITHLLRAARGGDAQAAGQAFARVYDELRRLARARLRQHRTMTLLDTTALVHESYLKLVGTAEAAVEDRHHFFAYASQVMRSVIVDFARARLAERRGGKAEKVVLDTALGERLAAPEDDVLRVHEALEALAQADERAARVVEMRYFGGLTEPEIAEVLGLSERTVRRDWEKARLMLLAQLG